MTTCCSKSVFSVYLDLKQNRHHRPNDDCVQYRKEYLRYEAAVQQNDSQVASLCRESLPCYQYQPLTCSLCSPQVTCAHIQSLPRILLSSIRSMYPIVFSKTMHGNLTVLPSTSRRLLMICTQPSKTHLLLSGSGWRLEPQQDGTKQRASWTQ